MDNFNKEAFIEEVEKRPVIWNTECPEYSDRILKRKAWNELTEIFADSNYSNEKKSIFSIQLQRKWKNLKDTYMKEYKKIRSNPYSGSHKGSSYMYYSKLSFLQKCLQAKPTTSSNESQAMEVDQAAKATELLASMNDSLVELMETASSLEASSNLKVSGSHLSSASSAFLMRPPEDRSRVASPSISDMKQNFWSADRRVLESKKKTFQRHENDDKLFCLSLYKEIRKVPENNRLAVKIQLLNVLQRAQTLPMNEIRMPYQHSATSTVAPWFGQYVTHPYTMSDPDVMPGASQPKPASLVSYLDELMAGESTSSEPRRLKRVFTSPLEVRDPHITRDSPVSSLDSSLSSNCSTHNYMDA